MAKKNKMRHMRDFENMAPENIISQIELDKRASENFQTTFFDNFRTYYRMYRSYLTDDEILDDRSNLFIPYTFHVIETSVPKLVLAIFNQRPYVQTVPLGVENNEERYKRSMKMNKLLDYQFQQRINIVPFSAEVIKNVCIYGTAITKQGWKYTERQVVSKQPVELMGVIAGYNEERSMKPVCDDPYVVNVPILDFFFDPAGTCIDDCRYVIHRYWEDIHELKDKDRLSNGKYINLDKLDNTDKADLFDNSTDMLTEIGISSAGNRTKSVEIWEYWTDEWVVKVADGKTVIYSEPNPYHHGKKPFSKWVAMPMANEFYGISMVDQIIDLQRELNTTRNQRIDNISMILNKMYKLRRGSNIDQDQLVSRPNGIIVVDEMEDLEEVQFTDVTQSAYREEAVIKNDMDTVTGVHDTERGSTPERRETATTMSILANAGGERFKMDVVMLEYTGLMEMVNQIIRLNQQYIDEAKEIMILGDDGVMQRDLITPEEILGEWDLVAVGSTVEPSLNKENRQQTMVQLYNILSQNQFVNHQELLKEIFTAFDIKNPERLIAQPQQQMVDPMLQAQLGGAYGQTGAPAAY